MWQYIERYIVQYLCPFFEYIKSKWKSTSNVKEVFSIFENFSEVKLYGTRVKNWKLLHIPKYITYTSQYYFEVIHY